MRLCQKKKVINKKNQKQRTKSKSHINLTKQQRLSTKNYMSRLTFYTPQKLSVKTISKSKNYHKIRNSSTMKTKSTVCNSINNTQSKNSNNYLSFLSRIVDRVGYQMIKKHNTGLNETWVNKQLQHNRKQLENQFIPNRQLIKTVSNFSRNAVSLDHSKANRQKSIDKYSFLNRIETIYYLIRQRQRLTPFIQYFLGEAIYRLKFKQQMKLKQFEDACLNVFNNADNDDLLSFMKQKINKKGIQFQNSQYSKKSVSRRETENKNSKCFLTSDSRINNSKQRHIMTHEKKGNAFNTKSTFLQSQNQMVASYLPKGKSLAIKSNNEVITLKRLQEKLNNYINRWGPGIPSKQANIN